MSILNVIQALFKLSFVMLISALSFLGFVLVFTTTTNINKLKFLCPLPTAASFQNTIWTKFTRIHNNFTISKVVIL